MIKIDMSLDVASLKAPLERMWRASGEKIKSIAADGDSRETPVYTVDGRYASRGWTEWTQGFVFGSALLQYDATDDGWFLDYGRDRTVRLMAPHLTHFGVHDHGFNNVSTYGTLLRLMNEGRVKEDANERNFLELALKVSGAVQARRWTKLPQQGFGYIYSFNGPQSLFADTIRSLRALAVSWQLGHRMLEENDELAPLLGRLVAHARTTAKYNVFYGEGRDIYDIRGRVSHESIFNLNDGRFRCPSSQQGYSPFTTWTRGLSWILVGCAEQLEFLRTVPDAELEPFGGRADIEGFLVKAATATADFFIAQTPTDGVPYWDTGAPMLHKLGDCLGRPSDPFNDYEPIDSSAAAICAQGFLRLGGLPGLKDAKRYWQAGLTILNTLLKEPYLSTDPKHQGLLLHSVYHRPNGWDCIPEGRKVPCGESSMWGDYHMREAALLAWRQINSQPNPTFFIQK